MANAPRVKMTITGEMYDVYAVGHVGDDGFAPYPHETAYTTEDAYRTFAQYAKRVAQGGDPAALLTRMQEDGVRLGLQSLRILEVDKKTFTFHESMMNVPSDSLYAKALAVMPKVSAMAEDAVSAQASAPGARSGGAAPVKAAVPEKKQVKITTVTQGSAARETMESALATMTKTAAAGGLKEACVMSARRDGVKVRGLDALREEEADEAAALGMADADAQTSEVHMPLSLPGDESEHEDAEERTPAPPPPAAPPVRTISGDEASSIGATRVLSEDGQRALQARRLEHTAADEGIDELTQDMFLNVSRNSAAEGQSAAEVSMTNTEHAGRQVSKAAISGTGRGGVRPGSKKAVRS